MFGQKNYEEKKDSDYNIASVHKVVLKSLAKLRSLRRDEHKIENMFRLEQIGLYRDNYKDEDVMTAEFDLTYIDNLKKKGLIEVK